MTNSDQKISNYRNKRVVLGLLLLLGFIASNWIWLDYRSFVKKPIDFDGDTFYSVPKGATISSIAKELHKQGRIENELYLKVLVKFNPELAKIKTGEYRLEKKMKPGEFLHRLADGEVIQYEFTIIEGQTLSQIISALSIKINLAGLDYFKHNLTGQQFANATKKLAQQLGLSHDNPEGWLYPETYFYTKGESALSLLRRSVKSMERTLQIEWKARDKNLPYESAYDALIMASIIEKETGVSSERAKIAGVFVRRLEKHMRLQTDPTVIYGIGANFNGNITRKDLKTATPYNTYVIKGLPPTPIATPSRESIHAALHPEEGSELYFVADGSGGHYFSSTNEEHSKAVLRMLKRNKNKN